ncbi:MAG: adenylate/guanylate cyclase domain-containing protein, partial [Hyphomicrobium sp.]
AVTPRGKDRPEIVFALLGDETYAKEETFLAWEQAHAAFLSARSDGDAGVIDRALNDCLRFASAGMADYYRAMTAQSKLRA